MKILGLANGIGLPGLLIGRDSGSVTPGGGALSRPVRLLVLELCGRQRASLGRLLSQVRR